MPMAQAPANLTNMAHNAGIPVYRIGRPSRQMVEQLPGGDDRRLLLSVCYPRLIPEPTVGLFAEALNVHPSLLPDLRGPDPMFWTFQRGTRVAGVSIHRLSAEYDAGAIVRQQPVLWIDDQTEQDLELRLSIVAADLLAAHLQSPASGLDQDHSLATWAPVPEPDDFRIQPDWSPQRVSDFVQGVSGRGVPIAPADEK